MKKYYFSQLIRIYIKNLDIIYNKIVIARNFLFESFFYGNSGLKYIVNNNFMKVTKERNPYLKRISSDAPHKYS